MLPGEPSWLAAVEPAAAAAQWPTPPLAFGQAPSGRALHVDLGDEEPRPAIAARGAVAVLLDASVFDRTLAAPALGASAHSAEPDEAFVLRAYVDIGERVLPLLRGSFSLVIWDGRRDAALFLRDPAGHLQGLLDRAVARVAPRSRVGVFLSGGADSAAVAASAAAVSHDRALRAPLALSLVFPAGLGNEEPAQRTVAAALGLEERLVPVADGDDEGVLAAGLRLAARLWTPCTNPWEAV